jgi:hypothetical protein
MLAKIMGNALGEPCQPVVTTQPRAGVCGLTRVVTRGRRHG